MPAKSPTSPTTSAPSWRKVQAEVAELKDAWLRAKAETENARRIAQADVAKAHKYAIERFAEDLLPVKDALEQTLAAARRVARHAEVRRRADAEGAAVRVRPRAGRRARIRSARSSTRTATRRCRWCRRTQPANTVVDVFQKGYLVNDRVLRPALVTVSSGSPQTGVSATDSG